MEQSAKSGVQTARFAVVLAALAEQRAGGPETPSAIPAGFRMATGQNTSRKRHALSKSLRDKAAKAKASSARFAKCEFLSFDMDTA
jgi:hypothetical protein